MVSNFHSSFSTAIKYCLSPSGVSSSPLTKILTGSVRNLGGHPEERLMQLLAAAIENAHT